MTGPNAADPRLLALRAARQAELASLREHGWPSLRPPPGEHGVSLTRVHEDARAVLGRIDAAEAAMRSILRAWALDPARGGAHLLVDPPEPLASTAATRIGDDRLPETVLAEPWPASLSLTTPIEPHEPDSP